MARLPEGVRRLPSGRYQWRVQVDGRRRTGTAASAAEAKQARSAASMSPATSTSGEALTVRQVLAAHRLVEHVAPTTRARDDAAVAHLPAVFLDRPAAEISTSHVMALWSTMAAAGAPAWSIHRAGVVLSKAWKHALKLEVVASNPVRVAPPPAPPESAEVVPPTVEEVNALIRSIDDPRRRLIVRLAAVTGARRGELCALQWPDLRLDAGEVVIHRSVSEVDGRLFVGETKTGRKGHRVVPLDPVTVAMVRRHERVVGCPWVFTHDGIEPWRPGYVTLAVARASKLLGLDITPHDLRHFAVSQWLASSVSPSTVAGLVGHSSVSTTLRTYAHLIRASGRDAVVNHAATLDA